ncbi:outer membrane protein assembly factor [Umezakia ovalisporum]|uniref:Outer membrane protein assembly factor n=1 Tax=Umezakia ovalisporum FSS-43 TaxID=2740520 RepID=A0ABT6K332_9CYAN|nr:outer membrane protein assembly factor [Umezakia ovalisporum]MDH6056774.1 outer membrane protein assembly factor [Umezakia ovalisporum FSS-43]MDH6066094.1 outer membrane protein assembly factor [Umezakia ovalisporum APH033B]MDH6072189.1 outer membrane protein assembly factor [Umezakia ovalisporum CobakiLakeA]MDH6074396.1 outer membrane protein assembly factor [Umezakia ovalisporum CS-1034]MDH6078561.1 outer membrane protein assembly factor [Umezakia ovalisporum FSS-45]
MQISSGAIFALATLATSNLIQPATATSITVASQDEPAKSSLVPVIEEKPTGIEAIASPETIATQQFSQNSIIGQISVPKNTICPCSTDENLVVTATDIQIVGATQELQEIVRQVIKTEVGKEVSQNHIKSDIAAILETGLFASAKVNTTTNHNGLDVVYQLQPVVVRSLQLSGAKILTYQVAQESFQSQIGKPISPEKLTEIVQQINQWYADRGYQLASVVSIKPNHEGILKVNVAEGLVGDIKFRFINDDGQTIDSKGQPVKGRTQPDFISKQLRLKSGQIFQENILRQDVQNLYRTGLFEIVNVALEGDTNKVNLVYELKELGARAINLGGSFNADLGLLGTFSYQDQNIGGVNDNLALNVAMSRNDLQFNTKFTSPYRPTEPDRIGYTINAFRRRELSATLDDKITLPNGDKVREGQIGAGISFQQPLAHWDTTLGFNYTRTTIRDRQGNITSRDKQGNRLSASSTGIDDLATLSFSASQDQRDNTLNPTQGSLVTLSTEQSVPIGQGNIAMNRLKANYTQYVPVQLFNTNNNQPQVFAVNFQAGTVIGNLPAYESFNLGGANSVRGYDNGEVGSARTYVLASAEYRFPIVPVLGGVVFADFASDLGSGKTVIGDPAGLRGKPGHGFGYGAGVRVNSPLGLIRADYGINDQGESKVHVGIGQRF